MTKAILEIDMPDSCDECPLCLSIGLKNKGKEESFHKRGSVYRMCPTNDTINVSGNSSCRHTLCPLVDIGEDYAVIKNLKEQIKEQASTIYYKDTEIEGMNYHNKELCVTNNEKNAQITKLKRQLRWLSHQLLDATVTYRFHVCPPKYGAVNTDCPRRPSFTPCAVCWEQASDEAITEEENDAK